jgi:hypothetical protein
LELHGPVFDDACLTTLSFPRLEILELNAVALRGTGFKGLEGVANLRHLRIQFGDVAACDFSLLPASQRVESLVLGSLPPRLHNVGALEVAFPALRELTLASSNTVHADTELTMSGLEHLTLEFPALPRWLRIPRTLRRLDVHSPEATDSVLRQLLCACPEQLDGISLRGTLATNALLEELVRFANLKYLDAADTRITAFALRQLAQHRTAFRYWPSVEHPCSSG